MKKIFISSVMATLVVSSAFGQVVETVMDTKLGKYHAALLKRPESKSLFQKFQTGWLAENNEKSLEKFLKTKASKGSVADKQLYAYFLMQKGKEQEVIVVLTSALMVENDNAQVYLDRANAYSRLLDFDRALVDVNKALELAEKTGEDDRFTLIANKLKGRFLTRQGKTNEAVAHWRDLAKKNPKDQELIEDVIDILIADSLFPSALELAVKLRDNTKDPYKKALLTLRVGDILTKQGERDKALATYVDTLDLSGDGSWLEREIVGQIQSIYKKEDNLNGLVKKFSELVVKYPQRVHIESKLAGVLVELARFDEAKKIYQSLLKKSPLDEDMRSAYFNMLKDSGDLKSARGLIDSMIKRKPEAAQLHLQRAGLSHDLKAKADVLGDLANYKKLAKVNALTALNYASLLNKYGFEMEAIASHKGAVNEYPDSLDTAIAAAKFLFSKKEKDEAVKIWSGVAPKVDRDGLIRLLDTLVMNGQGELAIGLLKSNYEEYKTNLTFLSAAIRTAEFVKDHELAMKYAYTQLILAKNPMEIDQAINRVSRLAVKAKKVDENIKRLVLKDNLSDPEKFLLADLEEVSGNLLKADEILVELAKSDKPMNLLQLTRVYERNYQFKKAAISIEKLIKLPNELKAVHLRRLAEIYQRAGNTKQALVAIQRRKTLSPNNKNVWLTEVDLLETVDGPEAALEVLRKGAQRFEGDKEILAKLASLNSESGRHSQADLLYWRLYDESEDMDDRIRWAAKLARSAQSQGAMEKVVGELIRRRRNSPRSVAPIMALAEVYRISNQADERRNLLLEAMRLNPDEVSLLIKVAYIDSKNGANKDAISILRKAQKLDKTGDATRSLAFLLIKVGNLEEAVEIQGSAAGRSDARMVENWVIKLLQHNALDEARAYLKKKLMNFPDDWRLLFLDNLILYELGDSKRAAEGALALFSRNNKIKNIVLGWDVDTSTRINKIVMMMNESMPYKYMKLRGFDRAGQNMRKLIQKRSEARFSTGYSRVNDNLLPINLKSLHYMANSLFFEALGELDENDKKDLLVRAEKAGIGDAELMFELYFLQKKSKYKERKKKQVNFFLQKIKKNTGNLNYYNYLVVSKLMQGDYVLPKEVLVKARELNKGDGDVFIRRCLAMFTATGLTDKECSEQVLAEVKKDDKLEDHEMILLLNRHSQVFRWNSKQRKIDPGFLAVYKKYFDKHKDEKVIKLNTQSFIRKNQVRKDIMDTLRRLFRAELLRGDDYEAIITAIESDNDMSKNMHYQAFSGGLGYHQGRDRYPLTYGFTTVSESQLKYFSNKRRVNKSIRILDKAKLKSNLDTFKNPILKIMAIRYIDSGKDVIPLLELAKINTKTKADAHLLHAHFLAEARKPVFEVLAQLKLASEHTLNKNQRVEINIAILNVGLDMRKDDFDKLDDTVKEEVRVVTRSLIASRKIQKAENIQKIIKHLTMERELDRYLNKNKASAHKQLVEVGGLSGKNLNSNKNSGRGLFEGQVRRTMAADAQLRKAIALKKTDFAVTLVYQRLRLMLMASSPDPKVLEKFGKKLNRLNLTESVLKKMDPKDSMNFWKWLDYYEVAKMTGDEKSKSKAVQFLSGLVVIPKRAKISIALAIYMTDRDRAIELLNDMSGDEEKILRGFFQDLLINVKTPKAYIDTLDFMNYWISHSGYNASDKVSRSNATGMILQQCFLMREADLNTYSPYTAIDKENQELINRRDKACDLFVRFAMHSEQVAEFAFNLYLKDVPPNKFFSNEIIAMVKNSLLSTAKVKKTPKSDTYFRGHYPELPDRTTYMAEAFLFKKDTSILDDDFLAKLKPLDELLERKLKAYKKLLLASNDLVLKEMKALRKDAELSDFVSWLNLLSLKSDNKLDLQLAEYFVHYLKDTKEKVTIRSKQNAKNIDLLIEFSLSSLYKNKKQKVLLDLVDKRAMGLVKRMNGNKFGSWVKIIESSTFNPLNLNDYVVTTFIVEMLKHPASLADGIKLAHKYRYPIGISERLLTKTIIKFDQYESLLAAGYLDSPEKMKLTKMPIYHVEDVKTQLKKNRAIDNLGGWDSAIQLSNSVAGSKTSCDLEYLAKSYKYCAKYLTSNIHESRNSEHMRRLISKLQKAPEENKYGADLFLTFLNKKTFESFVKEHVSSLKNAPKDHLEALYIIFCLDASAKNQVIGKSNKIKDLFLIDRAALKNKVNSEAAVFLARKEPFESKEFGKVSNFVMEFIIKNVAYDLVLTSKVVNHYAVLLDQSAGALEYHFGRSNRRNYLQRMLTRGIFNSYHYDGQINPFHLLRLVYGLDQLPVKNKLNLTQLIKVTMPVKWSDESRYQKREHNNKMKAILLEQGKLYNTLKDDKEKEFMKLAWLLCFNSDNHYAKLYNSLTEVQTFVKTLSSQNPKLKGFLDIINQAIQFDELWFDKLYDFRETTINIGDSYLDSRYLKFKAEMELLPVRYRCIIFNNIMKSNTAREVLTGSSNLRKMFVDTYEAAIKDDASINYIEDARYMTTLSMINGGKFSADQKQRLSAIGKSNIKKQIQYIKDGNLFHQDHFANNCALLAMTDEGKKDLLVIYEANSKHFKHVLPIAKLFLKCGFVEEIPRILPDLKNGIYRGINDKFIVSGYYEANADTSRHFQKLLKFYNTNREKALILSFVTLEPQRSFKREYKSDEFDAHMAGAEFINNAYKEGDVEHLENALYPIYKATSIAAAGKLDEVFQHGDSMVKWYLEELDTPDSIELENRIMFRVYISHLYAKGRYEQLFKIAEAVLKKAVKISEKENGSNSEKVLVRSVHNDFEFILNTGYIHMYDLYAGGVKGGANDELKKLLPFIRKYNELSASLSGIYYLNKEGDEMWYPSAGHRQMSKLIHDDLGESKAYTEWFDALGIDLKKQMQPSKLLPVNHYLNNLKVGDTGYGVLRKHTLLFKRLFNSEVYQKYVTEHQHCTEHLAIAMDRSAMSAQQVVDLYDWVEIEYKVPGFEAVKYGDLAHAYHRLEQYDKIVPLYAKMNEVLVKHPPIDQSVLAMTYYHQMRHLWIIKELEKALQVMPKGLEDKLDNETRQEYDKAVLEIQKWLNKKEVEK